MSLLISLLQASDESVLGFHSHGHFSSAGTYPLDPSGLGDPTATACLTLRFTGTRKPLHHGKLEIPLKRKVVKVNVWSAALWDAEG